MEIQESTRTLRSPSAQPSRCREAFGAAKVGTIVEVSQGGWP